MAEQVTIQVTENKTINVSDVLGNLKIADAAPTVQGLYILSDVGTYTNLGGLVTTAGKINYAYFNGTTWSKVEVDISNGAVIPDYNPALSYVEKSMTVKDNSIWRVADGQTANVGDVPGVSAKWVSMGLNLVNLENVVNPLDAKVLLSDNGKIKTTDLSNIKSMLSAGTVGVLKKGDAKPAVDKIGKYDLSDVGTYTNLVPVIAHNSTTPSDIPITTESNYQNSVYWDGTNFIQLRSATPQASPNLRVYEFLPVGTILQEGEQVLSNYVIHIVKDGETAVVGTDLPTGGKFESSKSQTIFVASKDASDEVKAMSNYVCDGFDDDIQINMAIQNISSNRGGLIILSEGRFTLSSPIIIDRALALVGRGRGIKLSLDNPSTSDDMRGTAIYQTTNTDVIKIDTPNKLQGFEIKDMLLVGYGRQNNPIGHGIHIAGGSDISVMRNLSISDCYAGIFYDHDVTPSMLDTPWIDQCSIQRNHVGLLAIGGHLMRITNNIFWENYGIGSYGGYNFNCGGVAIQGLGNHIIANNHFGENNFLEGSNVSKNSSHLSIIYSNPIVTGNVFNDIQGNAIKLLGFASYCKISNNYMNGFGKGTGLTSAQRSGIYIEGSQSNIISDNYMKSFEGMYGIYEDFTSFKNTFLNNVFQDLINNTANRIFSEGAETVEAGTIVRPDLLPEKNVLVGNVNQGIDGVKNFAKRTNFHENIVVGEPGLSDVGLADINGNLQGKSILLRESDLANGLIIQKNTAGGLGDYDIQTFKNLALNGDLHLQRILGRVGIGLGGSSIADGKKLDVNGNVAFGTGNRFDPNATVDISDASPQIQISRSSSGNNLLFYIKTGSVYHWYYGLLAGSNDYVIGDADNGKKRVTIKQGDTDVELTIDGDTGVISVEGPLTASTIRLKNYTVSTLPSSAVQGDTAYVIDAVSPTYLGVLVGGGSVVCPVFYNGANWVSH